MALLSNAMTRNNDAMMRNNKTVQNLQNVTQQSFQTFVFLKCMVHCTY